MNLKTTRASLLGAFKHVSGIVETRSTIPILQNVMLTAADGAIAISATDMEIAVSLRVTCDVSAPGTCTAPAATLYEIARKLPADAEVTLSWKDDKLTLRAGRYSTSLATLPVEDFPAMTSGAFPHTFQIDAKALASLFARTAFAMSNEATRYYLCGIYLHEAGANEVLRAVATDGHRLAHTECELPYGAEDMPGIIIPSKAVAEISKLLESEGGDVTVAVSETRIQISAGSTVLTSKLVDGKFPEYDRVIPKANDKILCVPSKTLAAAVGRVSTVCSGKTDAVKLSLAPGLLTISASSTESGTASEEIDAEFAGEPMEIGFNARYLSDTLGQLGADAEFRFLDGQAPAIAVDPAAAEALYVIMPMRV